MKSARTGKRGGSSPVDPALVALLPEDLAILSATSIATLWSSYGHIYRLSAQDDDDKTKSLVLKHIHPPDLPSASVSHARKLTSYAVERYFYQHLAHRLPPSVAVANAHPTKSRGALLLDDLRDDYPRPAWGSLNLEDTHSVLRWLAGFHATFWGERGIVPPPVEGQNASINDAVTGVWQQGCYFYLETRQEEFEAIDENGDLAFVSQWAHRVNDALAEERNAGRCTLLHGDAKGANIMFSAAGGSAFVDFQYVGSGVPTLDIIYFLGTSVRSSLLQGNGEDELLRFYYDALTDGLRQHRPTASYAWDAFMWHWELAIVDWQRFMAGWGCWGNDGWVERRARNIVSRWSSQGFAMQSPELAQ